MSSPACAWNCRNCSTRRTASRSSYCATTCWTASDHIDGLLDPKGYLLRLREQAPRSFYLVVEKILARHEVLREDWPIEGTTGYEFPNLVLGLLVDPLGEEGFT